MPARRELTMRQLRQMLRLHHEGVSAREIGWTLGAARSTSRRPRRLGTGGLLEILEDRFDASSTLVTSQVPVDQWHDMIGNPTLADAILDRLVHNAYRIGLKGGTKRKEKAPKADD